jgi:hypothetical protein
MNLYNKKQSEMLTCILELKEKNSVCLSMEGTWKKAWGSGSSVVGEVAVGFVWVLY